MGSAILDHTGKPFQDDGDGFAVPHVYSFQSMIGGAFRTYMHGRYDEAIRHSTEDALAMRNDPFIASLLNERMLGTASLKWHIKVPNEKDPHEKLLKNGLTAAVEATPYFQQMVMYLLEAMWPGRFGSQLEWAWKTIGVHDGTKTVPKRSLCIKQHQPVNGDKIGHKYDGTPYVQVHSTWANGEEAKKAEFTHATTSRALLLKGTWRTKFVIHRHLLVDADFSEADKGDAIHGLGIRSVIFWADWMRKEGLANILDFMERVGLGTKLWRYQASNPASLKAVQEAAKKNTSNVNILVPVYENGGRLTEGLEFVETTGSGAEIIMKLLDKFEEWIERYIIGQTLSSHSEGSGLGGSGVADLHADTKSKLVSFDANNLAETLTQDVVRVMQRWTYPELRDIPAHFVFDIDQPDSDKKLLAGKTIVDMGGKIKEEEALSAAGFSVPDEGDKVLGGQPMMPPGMPGAPGQPEQLPGKPGEEKPEEAKPAPFAEKAEPKEPEKPAGQYARPHDVSGEARDEGGKWTDGGAKPAETPAADPEAPKPDAPKTKEQHLESLTSAFRDASSNAGSDLQRSFSELAEKIDSGSAEDAGEQAYDHAETAKDKFAKGIDAAKDEVAKKAGDTASDALNSFQAACDSITEDFTNHVDDLVDAPGDLALAKSKGEDDEDARAIIDGIEDHFDALSDTYSARFSDAAYAFWTAVEEGGDQGSYARMVELPDCLISFGQPLPAVPEEPARLERPEEPDVIFPPEPEEEEEEEEEEEAPDPALLEIRNGMAALGQSVAAQGEALAEAMKVLAALASRPEPKPIEAKPDPMMLMLAGMLKTMQDRPAVAAGPVIHNHIPPPAPPRKKVQTLTRPDGETTTCTTEEVAE